MQSIFSTRLASKCRSFSTCRRLFENHFESKYADRLLRRAQEKGLSVSELREQIKTQEAEQRRQRISELPTGAAESSPAAKAAPAPKKLETARKDSSPVKPLSSILNLPRILSVTPAQVSALWTAYHASRSEGTGRGYLCAAIPLDLYQKMAGVASKYPTFVIPVSRTVDTEGGNKLVHEFYFLQWDFHEAPPRPSPVDDPFLASPAPTSSPNPQTSTILFTPLEEYKLRASFATPYLVLTHYTDLAHSHGLVLLRGEITASASTASSSFLLAQEDAQALTMAVQKFFLWGQDKVEGEQLLRLFHEEPAKFNWEDLLKGE
ncbi:ATP11 protein-domain-containing protein [Mycena floridula]|nr:ATP11 protein-domain-containing protein [Mycena floridula]